MRNPRVFSGRRFKRQLGMVVGSLVCSLSVSAWAQQPVRAPDASLETVSILAFTESPVYAEDGSVYFCDIANNRILRYRPGGSGSPFGGGPEVFRMPAGRAAGLVFDLQGRLLAAEGNGEGGNRRITRTDRKSVV